MILNFKYPGLPEEIKKLLINQIIDVSIGTDHVDIYAMQYYRDYSYWMPLCIYNDIVNPFNLIEQGIRKFKLFSKVDYQELLKEFKRKYG